jgi:hypothetical protein
MNHNEASSISFLKDSWDAPELRLRHTCAVGCLSELSPRFQKEDEGSEFAADVPPILYIRPTSFDYTNST